MKYWLGKLFLLMLGWRTVGRAPEVKKCIVVAAPHTSNWDAPIMLAVACVLGVRVRWLIKHTWFRGPLAPLIRALGGLPVDRRSRHDAVQQIVDCFRVEERLLLLITPEGTRGRTEYWRSGFYYIALGAKVPLVLGVVDYEKKRGGFGPTFMPTGNVPQDMDVLRNHFARQRAKYPECVGPVRLQMEMESSLEKSHEPGRD